MSTHTIDFEFGDRVLIDGDRALVVTVTGFTFRRPGYSTVEVSWVHNGASLSAWVEPWRITRSAGS